MKKNVLVMLISLILLVGCAPNYANIQNTVSQANSQTSQNTLAPTSTLAVTQLPTMTRAEELFSDYECFWAFDVNPQFVQLIKNNPIDKAFEKESIEMKEKHLTSDLDEQQFSIKYIAIWETELENTVKKLQGALNGEALKAFNESQSAWLINNVQDSKLKYEIVRDTVGEGGIYPALINYETIGCIRYRTLQLAQYCYMLTGSFYFEYKE